MERAAASGLAIESSLSSTKGGLTRCTSRRKAKSENLVTSRGRDLKQDHLQFDEFFEPASGPRVFRCHHIVRRK